MLDFRGIIESELIFGEVNTRMTVNQYDAWQVPQCELCLSYHSQFVIEASVNADILLSKDDFMKIYKTS